MATSKIMLHIAANCAGCNGISSYWRALNDAGIPFTVYTADDHGLLQIPLAMSKATLIYRDTVASDVSPPDYATSPVTAATNYWRRTEGRLPAIVKNNRTRIWVELLNEPGREPDQAAWVGAVMAGMAQLALTEGYRVMGPGWAAGNPEPEAWLAPGWKKYLELAAGFPERVAVSLHEYSLSNDIHEREPWLIGRFNQLLAAADALGVRRPPIYITECGWTLDSMPPDSQAKQDIDYLARLYAASPEVKSAHLWTLQGGAGNGDLPARLNSLIPWLTSYTLTTRFPDVVPENPPPTEPPGEPQPMTNFLKNRSFEEGWQDATEFSGQHPNHWKIYWNVGPNPVVPDQPYQVGEAVHLERKQLPPAEWEIFFLDGQWTLKVFGQGAKPIWARLKQLLDLPAGKYVLTTRVVVDCYRGKADAKDFSLEPNHAQTMVKANDRVIRDWTNLQPGTAARTVQTIIDHLGGPLDLAIHFRGNWGTSNNFWLDDWTLTAMTEPVPEPPPVEPPRHKAIVLKTPQNLTAAEWQQAAATAFQFRHTMTASDDDMMTVLKGGNRESYVKMAWPARQPATVTMVESAGYNWVPVLGSPVEGLRLGHLFAYRYKLNSGFNDPRPYANGKHEGADYDILGGEVNNKVNVLCAYDGVVDKSVDTTTGYGKYVRVRHMRYKGTFYTWYCHLDARFAQAGATVKMGDPIGEVGATGNADGEHVHFNLEVPGHGLAGYYVPDVVDPVPYLPDPAEPPLYGVETHDLLAYLRGDGRLYEVLHPTGQTETFQSQVDGPYFYQVKNSQWEQFLLENGYIYRGIDTSPGKGEFYVQFETGRKTARWCPRFMRVGQDWVGPGHQVKFYVKETCADANSPFSGNATNRMKLVARHVQKTWNNVLVNDVIELTNGTEVWFYARGFGLVAWRSAWGQSAIVKIYQPGERPQLLRERLNCQI